MNFNPEKPYNNLPLLPPKAEFETRAVLKKLGKRRGTETKGDLQN
jgi:hypothetical protein